MTPHTHPTRPGRVARTASALLQIAAFILGVGLLVWCATLALRPENRDQLERLAHAPPAHLAALLALTLLGLALDGLVFHLLLRPVRRIPLPDVLATNALAVFLNYLPFKIGLIARVVVHTRRDGVPLLTVAAMLAAALAVLASVALPLALASAWRGRIDAAWIASTLVGMLLLGGACVLAARAFEGPRGLGRLDRLCGRLPGWRGLSASRAFAAAHAGLAIAADPRTFAAAAAARLLFFASLWARFALAAGLVGAHITPQTAVLAGSIFFLVGVASPGGLLGIREGATTWFAGAVALSGTTAESFAVVALTVGAAESIINVFAGGVAAIYLRPDRWLLPRRSR